MQATISSENKNSNDRIAASSANESSSPVEMFDGLTGLRFLAAFFVFLGHSDQFLLFDPTATLRQMSLGVCVTLFFVLSGFVLTHAYKQLPTFTSAKEFLFARIAKVWPIHAITLTLFIIGMKLQPCDLDPVQILASLCLVQDWIPMRKFYFAFNTPAWSLSAEFFFYLLFPVIIQKQKRYVTPLLFAAYSITALCVIGADPLFPAPAQDQLRQFFAYWSPIPRVADFILGIQTYVLFQRYSHQLDKLKLPWTLMELLSGSILVFWMVEGKILPHLFISHGAIENTSHSGLEIWLASAAPATICAALVFLVAMGKGALSKLVSTRPAIAWGERSYALYMIHFPVFALILNSQVGWQPLPPPLLFAGAAFLSFAGSDFLYRVCEMPARAFIRTRLLNEKNRPLSPSKRAIACTILQAASLLAIATGFYFYDEIFHHRQPAMHGTPVALSETANLESAYWENENERVVLELNWRGVTDSTLSQSVAIQLLNEAPDSANSQIKEREIPLEGSGLSLKNQALKMRVDLSAAVLSQISHVRVLVREKPLRPVKGADKAPRGSARGSAQESLLLQVPRLSDSFINLSRQR